MLHRFYSYLLKNQAILALFLIALGWFVLHIRGIIMSIFLSYILMAALLPMVAYLQRRKFPSFLAAAIPFIGAILFLFLIILPLFPFFVEQIRSLITSLPRYFDESAEIFGFSVNAEKIQQYATREVDNIGRNAFAVTSRIFGSVFSALTVLIVTFYLLLYHEKFRESVANLFPKDKKNDVITALHHIDDKLGAWLRGQVVLSFVIGVVTWILLSIVGMPYALPLALFAGILETVPTLGPILAMIPAVIVALTISPTMALIVVLIYIVVQLLENNILVPKIMERAVGLNPVVVIIAVAIGANLLGIIGALLAIPFVSFLTVLFNSVNKTMSKSG